MLKTKKNPVKKETRGRPAAIVNLKIFKNKIFTAKSLHSKHSNFTLVTIQKILKKAKEDKIITLVDKKILDKTGRGRPILFYRYGKINNVKMTFKPKKPGKIYIPKYLKVDKIKLIKPIKVSPPDPSTTEQVFIDKKDNKFKKNTELDSDFAPAELELVEV